MLNGECCEAAYKLDSRNCHLRTEEFTEDMVFSVNRSFSVVYFFVQILGL